MQLILGGNLFGYSLDRSETFRLLDQASNFGIHKIDTAGIYSLGVSESIIGDWIWDRGLQLSTKIITKLEVENVISAASFEESLHRQFDASLSRLRSDSIETLLLHHFVYEPNFLDRYLDFVEKKIEIGQIKYWGICNIAPKEFTFLVERMVHRQLQEVTIQNYCNWAKRDFDYWSQFFTLTDRKKIRLNAISYCVFGRGALVHREYLKSVQDNFGKQRTFLNPLLNQEKSNTNLQDILRKIHNMSLNTENPLERFALSFILQQKSNVIVGVRSIIQLNSILESMRVQMSQTLIKEILSHIYIPMTKLELNLGDSGFGI